MSHLPFTLLAYLLNSISITINKFLLKKAIPDPFVYIFYVSAFSLILLPALPFTPLPSSGVLTLASSSTLLWTMGAYFMFKALKVGLLSRVIPVIGTSISLILLIFAFGTAAISVNQTWAVGLLILGLIFITILDWQGKVSKSEVLLEVLSAAFFALSYILLRQAYLEGNFFSVLVWSRVVIIPLILLVGVTPVLRKRVFSSKGHQINLFGSLGMIFLIGQALGGASELLLLFSISLANPALVNSLQGTQYLFLIIFGIFLKERYTKAALLTKLTGIFFIALGLYILSFPSPRFAPASTKVAPASTKVAPASTKVAGEAGQKPQIGVTFSPKYAHSLGLDPKSTYIRLLSELGVKNIRLPIYWDEIETFPRKFNFSRVDFYIEEAAKRGVEVSLVLGYKQPRWPECFAPVWVDKLMISEKEKRILDLVKTEVEHFKKYSNIRAWQVENEPYLPYGECKPKKSRILEKEVEVVKALDSRPVIITDSGELGLWTNAIKLSDTFGTTLYRQIWSKYLGSQTFPLPPFFYTIKNQLARELSGKQGETIISELQAEPWLTERQDPALDTIAEQASLMSVSDLKNNINYALETNFSQIYLWGVEWWYFMDKMGHPEYLHFAKDLFK